MPSSPPADGRACSPAGALAAGLDAECEPPTGQSSYARARYWLKADASPWDRLGLLGRLAAHKGLPSAWAEQVVEQLGQMGDSLVQACMELATELQAALFSPQALSSSLGDPSALEALCL